MFLRALRICDPEHIDDEINHINQIAKKLCYPNEYINNCWMQARKTFYQIGDQQLFNLRNIHSLPYHHELKPITRILKSLDINVAFKYESVIKNVLIRNSPVMVNNPGVYYIPCNECRYIYVGQSGKALSERCKQHRYNVNRANSSSALFIHKQNYDHFINWNGAKTVYRSTSVVERLIVENILISKNVTMNLSEGMYKLDDYITNKIIESNKVKRALRECEDFNNVN